MFSITNVSIDIASERSYHANTAQYLTLNRATITCNHRQDSLLQNFLSGEKEAKNLPKNSAKHRYFSEQHFASRTKRVCLPHCRGHKLHIFDTF